MHKVNHLTYTRNKSNTISRQNHCRPPVYQHLHHLSFHLGREKLFSDVMKTIRRKDWHGFSTALTQNCWLPHLYWDEIAGLLPDCSSTYQRLSLEPVPLSHSPLLLPLPCLTPNHPLVHHLNIGDPCRHSMYPAVSSQNTERLPVMELITL